MQINNNYSTNPTFGLIELKPKDLNKSKQLLHNITVPKLIQVKKDALTIELYNIFEPYLAMEAKSKAKKSYILEDVISDLKVKFWEIIQGANSKTCIDNIIEEIDTYKPSKDNLKPEYLNLSIDKEIPNREKKYFSQFLIEENLPIPQSEVEIDNIKQALTSTIEDFPLTEKNRKRLAQRTTGLTYSNIAYQENVSTQAVYNSIRTSILKIQKANNTISEENKEQITKLAKMLGISFEKALNMTTKCFHLLYLPLNKLENNLEMVTKLLGITKNDFVNAALKRYILFLIKPESLRQKVEASAKLFEISKNDFVNAALKQPTLFLSSPQTLNKNIETSAELFGVPKRNFIKAALKQPSLFSRNPENIRQNVDKAVDLLGISKNDFIKLALKQPTLFISSPETLNKNIETSADLFKISRNDFMKIVLKFPQLLYLSPKTLNENFERTAKLLEISKADLLKAALKLPSLLCMSPETLNKKIESASKLFEIPKKDCVESALKNTALFTLNSETLNSKTKIVAYYKKIKNNTKKINMLSSTKSFDTHYKNILNYLVRKNLKKTLDKKMTLPDMLKSSTGTIKLQIPKDDVAKDFIKFAEDYSRKTVGKNIFEFTIIE